MSDESNNSDKLLIDMFRKGFEETKTITQNLQTDNKSAALSLSEMRTELNVLQSHTDWLIRNVRDEGGDRSVMARLLMQENNIKSINDYIEEQKKEKESKSRSIDTIQTEDHKGKWQLRIALATGCVGFIATIITAILGFFLKK